MGGKAGFATTFKQWLQVRRQRESGQKMRVRKEMGLGNNGSEKYNIVCFESKWNGAKNKGM